MDGKLFLHTAGFLLSKGSNEADYRSAVSRAYYACFLEARSVVFHTCLPQTKNMLDIGRLKKIRHEKLLECLKATKDSAVQQLGDDLAGLCSDRNAADYKMDSPCNHADARKAVETADIVLKDLAQIGASRIAKAVDDYASVISGNNQPQQPFPPPAENE